MGVRSITGVTGTADPAGSSIAVTGGYDGSLTTRAVAVRKVSSAAFTNVTPTDNASANTITLNGNNAGTINGGADGAANHCVVTGTKGIINHCPL